MKLGVLADLHLDVNSIKLEQNLYPLLVSFLKKKDMDILLITGDISNYAQDSIKVLEHLKEDLDIEVLFIPGNHDIWQTTKSSWEAYELFKNHPSSIIEKPYTLNENTVIIGDMGWYDYTFAPDTIPFNTIKSKKKTMWSDAKYAQWGNSDQEMMDFQLKKIKLQLDAHSDKRIVFVNHFIPYKEFLTISSSNMQWNLGNAFMGSAKIGELIDSYDNVDYVLFGHTHKRYGLIDNYKDKTILCNPIGYLEEWKSNDFVRELDECFHTLIF